MQENNTEESKPSLYPQDKILSKTILPFFPAIIKPNHITLLRFFLIPLLALSLAKDKILLSSILFLIGAFTDTIDGALARVRNQITEWGKIYDPIADKLLIGTMAFILISKFLSFYLTLGIVILEIIIIAQGAIRKMRKKKVEANAWGKTKMIFQVMGILLIFLFQRFHYPIFISLSWVILLSALILGTISLFTYSI